MTDVLSDAPREIARAVENMPPVSPVLAKINEISSQMDTSPVEMVKIIMLDPVLTGKVIKLVNSSFYGLVQKVQSLSQAVVYLGINTVKNLAISTALLSTVFKKGNASAFDPEVFWQHCLATAICGKILAKQLKVQPADTERFFIAGLLHDIGKALLTRVDAVRFDRALQESRQLGVSLNFSEVAHFGCTHAQAGGLLARHWKLDSFLVEVIEEHHSYAVQDPERDAVKGIIVIANNICKQAQAGESGNCVIEEMADDIAQRFGISDAVQVQASEMLPAELEKAAIFLKIARE
ncbi:MAG: HDOD domain-containing protein [Deltaproteobacteria bacterium]|nr:HDOD domain-containing protein [Deltaproteobacteria bacterium]